jgi:hypothetical protein
MGTTPTYPMSINGIMLAGITLATESATFDPTQAVKRWVDASKAGLTPDDPANYMIFDPVSGTEVPLKITNAVAATANVPAMYATYTPTPATTPATLTCSGNPALILPVPATSLSTLDQANALAAEIGPAIGLTLQVTIWNQAGWTFNPNGETREQFMVFSGSVSAYVGDLLVAKYANGIGAPGSWSLNAAGQIVWNGVPVSQPGPNTPPDMPFPVRALLPGESFQSVAGMAWEVFSSNTFDPSSPATAGQVGQVQTDVDLIKQFLGINA